VPAPDPPGLLTVLSLFAYGPAPGVELIPYFLGLLAWVGLALGAIVLAPLTALLRRLRRALGGQKAEPSGQESGVRGQETEVGGSKEPPGPGQSALEGNHERG
jgi:hypothetical protein